MTQALYRTYRPDSFEKVLGQEHIVRTLTNAVQKNRVGQAYLFTGPRGTGKTTVARLLAKAANCVERENFTPASEEICKKIESGMALDIVEIDAASHTGVDNIRELKSSVALAPIELPFKVYIIDEVHMLSISAFNALLKTLEEPPSHAIFILATTEIRKVPETIISRCQRFDFNRIDLQFIVEKLVRIAKTEKITIEEEALEMIAISANGGMRDAESLFSQVIALEDQNITIEEVSQILGTTTIKNIFDLVQSFVDSDIEQAIQSINEVAHSGYNLETFANSLIIKLRALLFLTLNSSAKNLQDLLTLTKVELKDLQKMAQRTSSHSVVQMIEECSAALNKIRNATVPQLPLEIAAVNICGFNNVNNKEVDKNKQSTTTQSKVNKQQEAVQINKNQNKTIKKIIKKESGESVEMQSDKMQDLKNVKVEENNPITKIEKSEDIEIKNESIQLQTVKEKWSEIVELLNEDNHSLSMLLAQAQLIEVDDDVLRIGVKYKLHKDKLIQSANKLTIQQALVTILGASLRFEVDVRDVIKTDSKTEDDKKESKVSELLSHANQLMGGAVVE